MELICKGTPEEIAEFICYLQSSHLAKTDILTNVLATSPVTTNQAVDSAAVTNATGSLPGMSATRKSPVPKTNSKQPPDALADAAAVATARAEDLPVAPEPVIPASPTDALPAHSASTLPARAMEEALSPLAIQPTAAGPAPVQATLQMLLPARTLDDTLSPIPEAQTKEQGSPPDPDSRHSRGAKNPLVLPVLSTQGRPLETVIKQGGKFLATAGAIPKTMPALVELSTAALTLLVYTCYASGEDVPLADFHWMLSDPQRLISVYQDYMSMATPDAPTDLPAETVERLSYYLKHCAELHELLARYQANTKKQFPAPLSDSISAGGQLGQQNISLIPADPLASAETKRRKDTRPRSGKKGSPANETGSLAPTQSAPLMALKPV